MEKRKVTLKRKGKENNRIISTLDELKDLFGIFVGTIVCGNSDGEPCGTDDGKSTLHTMDFDTPQWYGSIEVCGLECVKIGSEIDSNARVFVKQRGKDGLCGILIPLKDIPIETISELAVDLSETFGYGDTINLVFSDCVSDITHI